MTDKPKQPEKPQEWDDVVAKEIARLQQYQAHLEKQYQATSAQLAELMYVKGLKEGTVDPKTGVPIKPNAPALKKEGPTPPVEPDPKPNDETKKGDGT